MKKRCCTCAKIFYEYSRFSKSCFGLTGRYCLGATEANHCSEFCMTNPQLPMPKEKFIESAIYTRMYMHVCKMGVHIDD